LRVLVLALGNPILGDDGVAFHIMERLRHRLSQGPDLALDDASAGGIDLLTHFEGFDRVLVLDALRTLGARPGEVLLLEADALRESLNTTCSHTTSLATALRLGRALHPDRMPADVVVLGVEAESIHEFREDLSPVVARAVPAAVDAALGVLRGWGVQV